MVDGRRPIPTAVKKLKGTAVANKDEPAPDVLVALGEPPAFIGEYGAEEWHRVGPVLIRLGLLTEADLVAFTAYCMTVQVMIEAKQDIDRNGMTIEGVRGVVRNPALATFAAATTSLRNLAVEFGMTPSARSRLHTSADDGPTLADLLIDDVEEDAE